ncbi:MAG: Ig-like domain-containing protein [Bacteroidetes bacterium]|nr:Ig-like domain-containing protein [Bacteroidota bacterium]
MRLLLLSGILILTACASQAPPGGGPEDKTAPTVLWSIPSGDSVRVDIHTTIQIAFSEAMNRNSTELAIFISPLPEGDIEYRWRKNLLTLTMPSPLPTRRTCVVTVGTDAMDQHGNPLANSYSFAFSTGDSIDRGEISGHVFADRKQNVSVWAYQLTGDSMQDDSTVSRRRADYITQIGSDGSFRLRYLAPDKYRVIAIVDLDQDYLYSSGSDPIGIAARDVDLGHMTFVEQDVDFHLSIEDTSSFVLQTAVQLDPWSLRLGFSHPLTDRYFENQLRGTRLQEHLTLVDSSTGLLVDLEEVLLNPGRMTEVFVLTKDSLHAGAYAVRASNVISSAEDTLKSAVLNFSAEPVTRKWKTEVVSFHPAVSMRLVPGDRVTFQFSGSVNRASFERSFMLSDSNGRQVARSFDWSNSALVDFEPARPWMDQMTYYLRVDSSVAMDWRHQTLLDTSFWSSFSAFRMDSLGVLSGMVEDEFRSNETYIIQCRPIQKQGRFVELVADSTGTFSTNRLVAGRYVLEGFQDTDRNGRYSFGKIQPFHPAERFAVYPDTLVIRPNWETANVILRFK